jgi:hypothetical protein
MFRKLVLTAAMFLVAASAAAADTQYGGMTIRSQNRFAGPLIALARHDDGSVTGRLALAYRCENDNFPNFYIRVKGAMNGQNFSASGKVRLRGVGTLRYTLTGALTPDGGAGRIRARGGCHGYTRDFAVRAAGAPAGAPAMPARASIKHGVTSQSAAGIAHAVSVHVASNGRVEGEWTASIRCGKQTLMRTNHTPTTTVKADGTFARTEHFNVKYRDGSTERFTAIFKGRFLADGATGTLRLRMITRKKGYHYVPCDSGVQTWAAR